MKGVLWMCVKWSSSMIPENILWSIFVQLTLALYRCHFGADAPPSEVLVSSSPSPLSSVVVLHRDIKPDNSDTFVILFVFS